MAGYRKTPRLNCNNAFLGYGVPFMIITMHCVAGFSSSMNQTNCIGTSSQFILDMWHHLVAGAQTIKSKSQKQNFFTVKNQKKCVLQPIIMT